MIPETIERLRLFKGPYVVQFGDFMNAGALDLVTKDQGAETSFLAEGGSFGPTPADDIKVTAYGFRYRLRLWSDFTFFGFTGNLLHVRTRPPARE